MHSFQLFALVGLIFASLVAAAPTIGSRSVGISSEDKSFIEAVLDTHNKHRRLHHVGDLKWDTRLASYAKFSANKCKFEHTRGPYGENLFAIWPGFDNYTSGTVDSVETWVDEVRYYNYDAPRFSDDSGHFTQVVWAASTHVGCSWNTVGCDGIAVLFCEYQPGGNVIGSFAENVFPRLRNRFDMARKLLALQG